MLKRDLASDTVIVEELYMMPNLPLILILELPPLYVFYRLYNITDILFTYTLCDTVFMYTCACEEMSVCLYTRSLMQAQLHP